MPLLQVQDCPKDIYDRIARAAQARRRTIAEQTIVLVKRGLGEEMAGRERRRAAFERIQARELPPEAASPDIAALLREAREERTAAILASVAGDESKQ